MPPEPQRAAIPIRNNGSVGLATVGLADGRTAESVIGRLAVRALYKELALYPKPGLVSPVDNGAHRDMNATTLFKSLFSLRHYFRACADAGAAGAPFAALRRLGLAAETRMMLATGGINTHRGAIFCLGLLSASAGNLARKNRSLNASALGECIAERWGEDIRLAGTTAVEGHGARVVRRYAVPGARQQAATGYPALFSVALPALKRTLAATADEHAALVQTLLTLMTRLDDTNVLHRGGVDGLSFVRRAARSFLEAGGVFASGWQLRAIRLHRAFVERGLSPGGSADMLAGAWFVAALQGHFR